MTNHYIKKLDNSIQKLVVKPDIIVESGIKEIDQILGGFKAGEITFIDGDSNIISNIPNQICVNTFRTFNSTTIYIDGGMCANPYKIAKYAKKMEMDQKKTLSSIKISRAFTLYQMSTLICDQLAANIKRYKPRTLIIGNFPMLYLDSDVKKVESQIILKNCIQKIKELTKEHNLITILTNLDKKMVTNRRNIRKTLYNNANETVRLRDKEKKIDVKLMQEPKETTILTFDRKQLSLQKFGVVI